MARKLEGSTTPAWTLAGAETIASPCIVARTMASMSPLEAQQIVEALACGVDPETGEILAAQTFHAALNSPRTVRALFLPFRALGGALGRPARAATGEHRPGKAGMPWSPEEDAQLLQSFDAGASVRQMAEQHERSRGGIASRLVRLGRIQERSEVHQRPPRSAGPASEAPP